MRITLSLIALTVSLLFIGAGANQVTEERSDRKVSRETEIKCWKTILTGMAEEIPSEHRKIWISMVKKDPESLLKMTASYR